MIFEGWWCSVLCEQIRHQRTYQKHMHQSQPNHFCYQRISVRLVVQGSAKNAILIAFCARLGGSGRQAQARGVES